MKLIAALSVVLICGGCIVVPVPTPEWGDAPVTAQQIVDIESGIGTINRSELVAKLGQPTRRYASDRVLVYRWVRSQGLWIIGAVTDGDITSGESEHRLCLLFSDSGVLADARHFDSYVTPGIIASDSPLASVRPRSNAGISVDSQIREWLLAIVASVADEFAHTHDLDTSTWTWHPKWTLVERDGLSYRDDSRTPFTGVRTVLHVDGIPAVQTHFVDGVPHGDSTRWYTDGTKERELHYDRGRVDGADIIWYPSGQISSKEHYENGQRHGLSTTWESDGSVSFQRCYRNGEVSDVGVQDCES